MQLRKLSVENWLHLESLEIVFAPVTMIFGRNATGKTAISNAIEFALTGRCRGLVFKGHASKLVRQGAKRLRVVLETDGNEYANTDNRPSTVKMPWPVELIRVACSPLAIVGMPPSDRQELFRAVLEPQRDLTLGRILTKLKIELPQRDGVIEGLLAKPAAAVDEAERQAIDARRAAKRALAELRAAGGEGPPAQVDAPNAAGEMQTWDVSRMDPDATEAKLARLEKELSEAYPPRLHGGNLVALDEAKQRLKALDERIANLTAEQTNLRQEIKEAKRSRDRLARRAAAEEARAKSLVRELGNLREQASALMGTNGHCVLSTKSMTIRCPLTASGLPWHKVKHEKTGEALFPGLREGEAPMSLLVSQLEAAVKVKNKEVKAAEEAAEKAAKQLAATPEPSDLETRLEDLNATLARLQQQREEAVADVEAAEKWPELAGQIERMQRRIETGRILLAACREYRRWAQHTADLQRRRESLTREVAAYDALAKALAGPVRESLTEAIEQVQLDTELMEAWSDGAEAGFAVMVEPDGGILVNGRPVELASLSERWRAGMLVTDLLLRRANVGWIVLDDTDILDRQARKPLTRWLARARENYANVVLLAAAPTPPEFNGMPDWMQAWWLQDGQLRRIGGAQRQ